MAYNKEYYEQHKDEINAKRRAKRTASNKEPAHSIASPSSLHRLLVCPGSAVMCKNIPPEPPSVYAQEGTVFHAAIEECIKESTKDNIFDMSLELHKLEPEKLYNCIDVAISNTKIPVSPENREELREYVPQAYDWFMEKAAGCSKLFTEQRLPMFYSDTDKGSLDCALVFPNRLVIIDWKYGKGVDVEVQNNPQLIAYTVSMLKYLSANGIDIRQFEYIETIIYQPRIYFENKVKSWTYNIIELIEESKKIKLGVDTVYEALTKCKRANSKKLAEYIHTSENGCRFCPAKMKCKKYLMQAEELVGDLVEKTKTPVAERVTLDLQALIELGKKLEETLPKLEQFYKEIQDYFMTLDNLPENVYQATRAARLSYISDTDKVLSVLQENNIDGIDHSIKLVTITSLKKLLKTLPNKDDVLAAITEKKEGSKYITFDSSVADANSTIGDL